MHTLQVGEAMSRPAVCVDPRTRLTEAHLLMKEQNIRRLPVVEEGRLVGIITLGDVRGASPSEVSPLNRVELAHQASQIPVERVMTREVITVRETTPLIEAARQMVDNKISGLPVVGDDGRVVGIVTESDLFLLLVTQDERGALVDVVE